MLHTVATPVTPQRVSAIAGKADLLNTISEIDFGLDSSRSSSGDPTPSAEDMDLTRRLATAGALMGIDLADHVILGDVRYWSVKEAGRL